MQYGRISITTDEPTISYKNVIDVLRKAMPEHLKNAARIDYLLRYEMGEQPIIRKEPKKYRPDIDVSACDNVANEITEFKTSFNWNPITLVQRGEEDSGGKREVEAIALLNECYATEEIAKKTRRLARYVEVGGLGYTYTDINTDYEDGDSYFKIDVLDPRFAFVIRSSRYPDRRVMMGVTFRRDTDGNKYFTCFTNDRRYEIKNMMEVTNGEKTDNESTWNHDVRSGEKNPLGRIPIIEWIRDYDRMGCFERQISALDNLNLLLSDFSNDVETMTSCVWWTSDVDFPKTITTNEDGTQTETIVKPKDGEWLSTYSTPDGKTPSIQPLTIDYNYDGMTNHYLSQRALILQKCNVPARDSEMSNSTGLAASFAGGYAGAETQADKQIDIQYGCKMEEIRVVLSAIKKCPGLPSDSPLRDLRYTDVQPKAIRNKNYELTVKSNCLSVLLNCGVHPLHALRVSSLFDDVNQVYADSRKTMDALQKSLIGDSSSDGETAQSSDRITDQASNSPLIDGMSTGSEAVTA